MKNVLGTGLVAFLLLLATGCASQATLTPAPGANELATMEEAAISVVDGVRAVAQVDEWRGAVDITQQVTPVRVIMENNSSMPVALRYREFALIGTNGERYSALPPYRMEGTVQEPITVTDFTPVGEPVWTYTGFELAPFYGPVYPGLTPYAGTFTYDPFYYDNYYTYWANVQLPTEEMLQHALPEGVLNAGGRIEGYLYFENVPDDVRRVYFTADLVNPVTGRMFGEIRIPFTVE